MIWDEKYQRWMPRWGYKRGDDPTADWAKPENTHAKGDYEDPFQAEAQKKKQRIEKQKKHQIQNTLTAMKETGQGISISVGRKTKKKKVEVQTAFEIAKSSTASMGRFDKKLDTEKAFNPEAGKRRKFQEAGVPALTEKTTQKRIMDNIFRKEEGLNLTKAVNRKISNDRVQESRDRKSVPKKRKRN